MLIMSHSVPASFNTIIYVRIWKRLSTYYIHKNCHRIKYQLNMCFLYTLSRVLSIIEGLNFHTDKIWYFAPVCLCTIWELWIFSSFKGRLGKIRQRFTLIVKKWIMFTRIFFMINTTKSDNDSTKLRHF